MFDELRHEALARGDVDEASRLMRKVARVCPHSGKLDVECDPDYDHN